MRRKKFAVKKQVWILPDSTYVSRFYMNIYRIQIFVIFSKILDIFGIFILYLGYFLRRDYLGYYTFLRKSWTGPSILLYF